MGYLDSSGLARVWEKIANRLAGKQDKLTGAIGQVAGFNQAGELDAQYPTFTVVTDGNPVGTIISFMGKTAPNGYLACEGGVFNISAYPELADFFRTQFGSANYFGGNGSTTFAVPDMRNLFLRGYHGSTTALSGEVGKKQEGTNVPSFQIVKGWDGTWVAFGAPTQKLSSNTSIADITNADSKASLGKAGYVITDETTERSYATYTVRPVNMAVLYCIKAVL